MCYRTGKYTVSQVRPCIFQPGNFTGRGGEGVKPHVTESGLSAELRSAESVRSRLQQLETSVNAGIADPDDNEMMLNVLRCQLTY